MPAYFHPAVAGADWQALAAHGTSVRAVVLNSADGPGPVPERELTVAAVATGRPLLGYVDTHYGRRDPAAVRSDVDRWRHWYPTAGLFFDRVGAAEDLLPWYTHLMAGIRDATLGTVVFNHGTHPDPGYAALADALVTFEGPYAAYERLVVPAWTRDLAPDRLCHLVYDTPEGLLPTALARAAAAGAGGVYVTDRAGANPWGGVPAYLGSMVEAWCR